MAKGKGAKKGGGPRAPAARVTPQQLYEQAQLALRFNDIDSARTALRKAVKMDPKNVEYVDALGALLAEVGPEEEAVEILRRAVSLSPETGYEKYLYLGQLLEQPQEALAATRKGVQVLQAQHAAAQAASSPAARPLSRALAGAMCSLSEMLLAAARMQDEEEEEQQHRGRGQGDQQEEASGSGSAAGAGAGADGNGCGGRSGGGRALAAVAGEVEHLLALASTVDPSSPEPGQALAAFRYEQGRATEALEALRRSMSLWFTPSSAGEDEEGDGEGEGGGEGRRKQAAGAGGGAADDDAAMEDAEDEDEDGDDDGDSEDSDQDEDDDPSYEFRVECAKLLLELEDTTATAIDVLEGLIEEDDRVPDAWHLLALAYYSGHQYAEAAAVLERGQQALVKALGTEAAAEVMEEFADLESAIKEALELDPQQQQQQQQQQQ